MYFSKANKAGPDEAKNLIRLYVCLENDQRYFFNRIKAESDLIYF